MEERCISPAQEISTSVRDMPPAHYTFRIESFSSLLEAKIDKCESCYFKAAGHRWRLSLYPNGRKERNGNDHISLYLTIVDTQKFVSGWQVNVNFKMFVFDLIRNKYLTIQDADAKVRQFHENKKEWGLDKLISLSTFNDPSNGYLVDDCCVFGVEVLVIERNNEGECLKLIKLTDDSKYTWKIENFSTVKQGEQEEEEEEEDLYNSESFTAGDKDWKILLYPRGNDVTTKYLSLFLVSEVWRVLPAGGKKYVQFSLTVKDQVHGNHIKKECSAWLETGGEELGFPKMMLMSELKDPSKGFLVNDTLIVKARLCFTSKIKKAASDGVAE